MRVLQEVVVRYERAEDLLSERADEEAEVHRHAYNRVRVPDTDEHGNDGVVLCDRCRGDEQLPEFLTSKSAIAARSMVVVSRTWAMESRGVPERSTPFA